MGGSAGLASYGELLGADANELQGFYEVQLSAKRKSVSQNHLKNVAAHNCALWDSNGKIDFFLDPSISGSVFMSTDNSRMIGERIQVQSRKLSDFVRDVIDFLKLDVEASENRILTDLVSSGKIELVKQMVIEYNHHIGNQRSRLLNSFASLNRRDSNIRLMLLFFRAVPAECFRTY